jgi:hypothetical protein
VQCVRRMQQGDGGSSEKNGGRKTESPELFFIAFAVRHERTHVPEIDTY